MGGNITNSGIEGGTDVFNYSHVHIKSGRFRIFATGVQGVRGVADFRIDSPAPDVASPQVINIKNIVNDGQTAFTSVASDVTSNPASIPLATAPHQIVNVRSEGDKGRTNLNSSFVYVPNSPEKVDIDIVNSAGSWALSGLGKSSFAKYNAAGTLRLIGNSSAMGAGIFVSQDTPTNFKLVAVANTLSKLPQLKCPESNNEFYANNFYANRDESGSFVSAPYFKLWTECPQNSPNFPILLNIDIPQILSRPRIDAPLPGMIDVQKSGAKGDGVNDDTVAIQQALNSGSSVFFPAGHYRISQSLKYNTTTEFSHGAGGFIAGSGSESVVIDRFDGGAVFETQGMAYATMQGITLKSKRDPYNSTDKLAALNFEYTPGIGHATQSNSIYDVAITDANIGVAIGNTSATQCSENIFNGISLRNLNLAVSIGSYNALSNVFVNLKADNIGTAIGHGGQFSGGTWSIVGADLSNIEKNVFYQLNASDGIFFFDKININNTNLFTTNDTAAPFNLFFNKSNLNNSSFFLKSAGGVFLNDSDMANFIINSQGILAQNYIINNTKYGLRSFANLNKGTFWCGL
jgi:hypothetical protein